MAAYWDARRISAACVVEGCPAEATVIVVDPDGNEHGPHCGPHADERVNRENAPLYEALRASEAERIRAEREAAEAVVAGDVTT